VRDDGKVVRIPDGAEQNIPIFAKQRERTPRAAPDRFDPALLRLNLRRLSSRARREKQLDQAGLD